MQNKYLKNRIFLIVIFLAGFWIINNLSSFDRILSSLFRILLPFFLGGCLAFILNIPMSFFEKKLSQIKKVKKKGKRLRIASIVFAFIIIVLILTLIIRLILPELIKVIKGLIDNIPYYIEELSKFVENHVDNSQDINNTLKKINIDEIKNQIMDIIPNILTSSISIITEIIRGVSTFFIALIFAIYILIDKEKLQGQLTKMLYAYFKKEKVDRIVSIGKITSKTFKKFFTVQCLEATILGILCILGMIILRIPYAVPIGVLIGVTALIPVVGAFIGIIIGAILIVAINPIKVITFIIFVLILQQIEGNLIYPRVVGTSVGLPGMWVLFAVTVGGSLGGILGMLLGVPVATVIYFLLKTDVNKKIE